MEEPISDRRLPLAAWEMCHAFVAQTERHESGRHSALRKGVGSCNYDAQHNHEAG
jgi:hypothetical protein